MNATGSSADVRVSLALPHLADALETTLDDVAGESTGFILFTFRFNTTAGRAQHISNVPRDRMIDQVERLLRYWRDGSGDVPLVIKTADLPVAMPSIGIELRGSLERIAGEYTGFALLVFLERHSGRPSYISNAARPDVTVQLAQLLEYWKSGAPDVPAHQVQ
jgi:hypothetical protein